MPQGLRTSRPGKKWVSGLRPEIGQKYPEGPKIKKNRDFDRDWKFRLRMKFSSEPPTAALFFVGEIETSRLKFSSGIKNFDRD